MKTNTKVFFKAAIEGLMKYWPGVSYIVLRSNVMVPGERLIISIGYRYNSGKVLSFIAIAGAGITTLGIPYLSNYLDQFSNVSIQYDAGPNLMSNFFGLVNEVGPKNESRQSYLELEKFWVTQCGWLWLFTTFSMGMKITNCWKLF